MNSRPSHCAGGDTHGGSYTHGDTHGGDREHRALDGVMGRHRTPEGRGRGWKREAKGEGFIGSLEE